MSMMSCMSVKSSQIFWNLIARKYLKTSISDIDAYQFKIDLTKKYLSHSDDVLEIGSGTGSTALIHAPFVNSYQGIDYSQKMVQISGERLRESILTNLNFNVGTLFNFQFDKKYNVILALNFLHLTKNLKRNINKCYELIEDKGYFITSTACLAESESDNIILKFLSRSGVLPYLNFFSAKTLESKIKDAGFKIVEKHRPGKDQKVLFIIAQK